MDKELLSSDEYAADGTLDISELIYKVLYSGHKQFYKNSKLKFLDERKFIYELTTKKTMILQEEVETFIDNPNSKVVLSIDCLTEEEAKKHPVGEGRSDPNNSPFLAKPQRFSLGLSPLDIIDEMFGPEFMSNLIIYGSIGCVVLLIFMFLLIMCAVLAGNAINGK